MEPRGHVGSWVIDGEPSKAKTEVGNEGSWSCSTDWGLELVLTTREDRIILVGDGYIRRICSDAFDQL